MGNKFERLRGVSKSKERLSSARRSSSPGAKMQE